MKATIFAANGQVTAIAFPGESMNFNGIAVHEVEAEKEGFEAALLAVVPSGVGSPWPPIDAKAPAEPKAPKAAKPAKV
jgi:hypothetical protein